RRRHALRALPSPRGCHKSLQWCRVQEACGLSGFDDEEARAREMNHDFADTRVFAPYRYVLRGGGDEFARNRVAAIIIRHHGDIVAGLQAIRLAGISLYLFGACCVTRNVECCVARNLMALAVANFPYALFPGENTGESFDELHAARARNAGEGEIVIG